MQEVVPVKVLGGADSDKGVGVCEGREDTDPESDQSVFLRLV